MNQLDAFPPKKIKDEITKKGFSVYPYISLKELSMTIQKDFLTVLDKIKYLFLILLGIAALIGQEVGFLIMLMVGYIGIFIYLALRLLWRTRAFIYLNNVIFTPENLITGYQVHNYQETQKIKTALTKHAELFDEYLGQASSLAQKIKDKRKKVLSQSAQDFGKVSDQIDIRDGDSGKLALYFFLIVTAYSISLILFYYIGILFVFAFFFLYAFFIKTYLLFFERRELHVKNKTEQIEKHLTQLKEIEIDTHKKIKNFQDGQIFDLEKYVDKNFGTFYQTIEKINSEQKKLRTYINQKFEKNLIDFDRFEKYIWQQVKIPAQQMISLLQQIQSDTKQQIIKTKKTIHQTTDKHLLGPLEQKLFNLQQITKATQIQLENFLKVV